MENKAKIEVLVEQLTVSANPNINELVEFLAADKKYLFLKANEIRKKYCGKEVHLRGIIEFSNFCRCDCLYCGLQRQNKTIPRYRMTPEEIIKNAQAAYHVGYKTIVLQSGEDPYYTKDMISHIIKKIKASGDIALTLSIGERTYSEYHQWKKDGADRYLLKHETADSSLYKKLHPHSTLEKRVECLRQLKSLGYQTGSGFMIGLPGQTLATIAKDLLLLKKLEVEMAGIGPFIPHPATPLGKENTPSDCNLLTLKAIALARIMLKRVHLPSTTAFEVSTKTNAFCAGANVLMRKVEPYWYRQLYEIYPHPWGNEKTLAQERKAAEDYIRSFNRTVSTSKGNAIVVQPE
jgi:biotin synthase